MDILDLVIVAKGEVLSSNLAEFSESVQTALACINRSPKSDEEFGQAEADVKVLKAAEQVVKSAKEDALAQAADLNALFSALDASEAEVRQARLELEKLIKDKKAEIRKGIVDEAMSRIDCAARLRPVFSGIIENHISGKRSLASMREAVGKAVALCNRNIKDSRAVIDAFITANGETLVVDREELEVKNCGLVEAELRRRLEAELARVERERLRAEAEAARAVVKANEAALRSQTDMPVPPSFPSSPRFRMQAPSSPVVPVGLSEVEEFRTFCDGLKSLFADMRQARGELRHQVNIDRVGVFASAVNAAWAVMMGGAR